AQRVRSHVNTARLSTLIFRDARLRAPVAGCRPRYFVDLDSTFTGGYRGLDWTELLEANVFFGTRNLADAQTSSEALARRAGALDGTDAEARALLSAALLRRGDHLGAKAEA